MTADNSAPSVYSPVRLKSSHTCLYEWVFQLHFDAMGGPPRSQRCTSIICHVSNISRERDTGRNVNLPFGISVCQARNLNPGNVGLQDACPTVLSLDPAVLVALRYFPTRFTFQTPFARGKSPNSKSDKQTTENIWSDQKIRKPVRDCRHGKGQDWWGTYLLLNPIHIKRSETDVSVGDINKWADSRDPEGTAAQGGEGEIAHLCCHVGFIRRVYIFTLYLALHSLLELENAGMQRERWQVKARMAAFGKGRMVANRRVGMKENQVLCL